LLATKPAFTVFGSAAAAPPTRLKPAIRPKVLRENAIGELKAPTLPSSPTAGKFVQAPD
jgi:hypothetical protein